MEGDIVDIHLSPAKFMPWRYSIWTIKSTDEDTLSSLLLVFLTTVGSHAPSAQ